MNSNDTPEENLSLNYTLLPQDLFTPCEIFYFVVSGLIGIITIVFGLVGNTLAFIVLNNTEKSSITFFILKALAIVDTVFLVTYGLVRVTAHIMDSLSIPGTYGTFQYVLYLVFPLLSMTLTLTLWLTCLLTVHRYIGICKAFDAARWSTLRQVRLHVAVMIVLSAALEIVRYFDFQVREYHFQGNTYIILYPTDLYENDWYQLLYRNVLMTGLRTILPIIITTVLTIYLVKAVLQLSRQKVQFLPSSQKNLQSPSVTGDEARVTRTLILIAVLMIVFNIPIAIIPILFATMDISADPCSHFYHYFATIAEALAALNSALNFYIYYPTMPTLRAELTKIATNLRWVLSCNKANNKVYATARKLSVKVIDIVTENVNKHQ